jgi:hypothetical protein
MREGGRVWAVGCDVMLEECNLIVIRFCMIVVVARGV